MVGQLLHRGKTNNIHRRHKGFSFDFCFIFYTQPYVSICWYSRNKISILEVENSHDTAFLNIITKFPNMETIFPNMVKVFSKAATNLQLIANPIYTLTSFHNRFQSVKTGEEVCTALVTQDKTQFAK